MSNQLVSVCSGEMCPMEKGPVEGDVSCAAREKASGTLQRYFTPALHGKDIFVQMATGSGKSLCMYLVPLAVSDSSIGIISPLIGLMGQQVRI